MANTHPKIDTNNTKDPPEPVPKQPNLSVFRCHFRRQTKTNRTTNKRPPQNPITNPSKPPEPHRETDDQTISFFRRTPTKTLTQNHQTSLQTGQQQQASHHQPTTISFLLFLAPANHPETPDSLFPHDPGELQSSGKQIKTLW